MIAASGRRPVEILIRGSFALTKELPEYLKHGYFVNFKGQAKKRDYDMPDEERAEYRIGVLVPAQFFLEAFERFRKMPETKELFDLLKKESAKGTAPEQINDAIESRRGNSLRRVVKREFGSFLPARFGEEELDNKTLRAVYVRLIVERDCPKSIDGLLWASRSVGHFIDQEKPDDSNLRHLSTTLGYSDYYCESEVPFVEAPQKEQKEKLANVKALTSDFELIKQLQIKWNLPNQQAVIRYLIEKSGQVEALERQIVEKDKPQDTALIEIQQLKDENQQLRKELQNMTEQLQEQQEQIEAQSQSSMPTQEVQKPQVQQQDLQDMVRQFMAEELRKVLPQVQSPTSTPTPAVDQQAEVKVKQPKPERDWSIVSNEELWASKARGATDERILRAFRAVSDYNDYVATSNDDRWFIGAVTLRSLTNCNGTLVSEWIEQHKQAVEDHNNKYQLGQYHNKRHKGKSITDVVKLIEKPIATMEEASKSIE